MWKKLWFSSSLLIEIGLLRWIDNFVAVINDAEWSGCFEDLLAVKANADNSGCFDDFLTVKAEIEWSGYFDDFLAVKTDVEMSEVGKVNYL